MRGGLELVVKVVHVVEPIGGMQGRMLREGMTSAQEIAAGSSVADGTTPSSAAGAAATTPAGAAAATATAATAAAVTSRSDRSRAAGQSEKRKRDGEKFIDRKQIICHDDNNDDDSFH